MEVECWTVSVRVTADRVVTKVVSSTGDGDESTVLKLLGGVVEIVVVGTVFEKVVAALESVVKVGAAGGEAAVAGGEKLGAEPNIAARSSERDWMKASSFCCNCSTVNGNSTACILDPFSSSRLSINDGEFERSCSGAAIGKDKTDEDWRRRRSLPGREATVVSERLRISPIVFLCSDRCSSRKCLNGYAAVIARMAISTKDNERSALARAIVVRTQDEGAGNPQDIRTVIAIPKASHHLSCNNRGG